MTLNNKLKIGFSLSDRLRGLAPAKFDYEFPQVTNSTPSLGIPEEDFYAQIDELKDQPIPKILEAINKHPEIQDKPSAISLALKRISDPEQWKALGGAFNQGTEKIREIPAVKKFNEFIAPLAPKFESTEEALKQGYFPLGNNRYYSPVDFVGGMKNVAAGPAKKVAKTVASKAKSLTTSFLKYAEEKLAKNPKAELSRQEILDFARRPELKKGEADLLNNLAKDLPDGKLPAQDFADSIRRDLLELKPITLSEKGGKSPDYYRIANPNSSYKQVTIDAKQGTKTGKNYEEVVFESPINTGRASSHYPNSKNYFAHARGDEVVEGGKKIWREQEIQSDLFAKKGLEGQATTGISSSKLVSQLSNDVPFEQILTPETFAKKDLEKISYLARSEQNALSSLSGLDYIKDKKAIAQKINLRAKELEKYAEGFVGNRDIELNKLSPFTNDRFGERIMRERIKEKAQKGYSKYRLPTGETVGRIEGFTETNKWWTQPVSSPLESRFRVAPDNVKIGQRIFNGDGEEWVVNHVMDGGRIKAIPRGTLVSDIRQKFPQITPKDIMNYLENCL